MLLFLLSLITESVIGGIVYPIIFNRLLAKKGFGWATRTIGFCMLGFSLVPVLGLRQRVRSSGRRQLIRFAELKDIPFQLLNLGAFFGFIGVYVVFFYIQVFADTAEASSSERSIETSYLIAILNAGGVLGRFLPNTITDKVGYLNMQTACGLATTIVAFCWIRIHTATGVFAFAPIFAFFAGGFSTFGPTVVSLTEKLDVLGTRMGINLFVTGVGVLIGPPVAGAIQKGAGGGWLGVQLWCAFTLALSTCFMAGTRVSKAGLKMLAKA